MEDLTKEIKVDETVIDSQVEKEQVEDTEDRSFIGKLYKLMVSFNKFFFTERMEIVSEAERIEREQQEK